MPCCSTTVTCHGTKGCCCCTPAPTTAVTHCYDVSVLLNQLNALRFPALKYTCPPHPPIVPLVDDTHPLPLAFGFDTRLIRDELHQPLLCYLAEGVASTLFATGLPATRIEFARQLAKHDTIDGYSSLRGWVYASICMSINAALLLDLSNGTRLWSLTSHGPRGQPALELRLDGKPSIILDIHPPNVVSNDLIVAVLEVIKGGAAYDASRGRVISEKSGVGMQCDALTLLTQVYATMARTLRRPNNGVSWLVLSNLDRSLVFYRGSAEISVSHIIKSDGISTPRDSVQNLYSLLLAVSVLERHQYSHPPLVDLL